MATLNDYLLASGLLFTVGFAGVLLRRNIIIIFMALELMLNAANLSLVGFSRFHVRAGLPDYNAQVLVFLYHHGGGGRGRGRLGSDRCPLPRQTDHPH